jgi:hypothetical protein
MHFGVAWRQNIFWPAETILRLQVDDAPASSLIRTIRCCLTFVFSVHRYTTVWHLRPLTCMLLPTFELPQFSFHPVSFLSCIQQYDTTECSTRLRKHGYLLPLYSFMTWCLDTGTTSSTSWQIGCLVSHFRNLRSGTISWYAFTFHLSTVPFNKSKFQAILKQVPATELESTSESHSWVVRTLLYSRSFGWLCWLIFNNKEVCVLFQHCSNLYSNMINIYCNMMCKTLLLFRRL